MKKIIKSSGVFLVVLTLLIGFKAIAASEVVYNKNYSNSILVNQNPPAVTSALILAENIKPGFFGENVFGNYKDYFFPSRLTVNNSLMVGGGITVSQSLPSVLSFLPDRGPVLRADHNVLKFLDGEKYYFDNNVGIKTTNPTATFHVNGTLKAGNYIASNGQYGLTKAYSLKGSNNQNCSMIFTNGLLTGSTCPILDGQSIK